MVGGFGQREGCELGKGRVLSLFASLFFFGTSRLMTMLWKTDFAPILSAYCLVESFPLTPLCNVADHSIRLCQVMW